MRLAFLSPICHRLTYAKSIENCIPSRLPSTAIRLSPDLKGLTVESDVGHPLLPSNIELFTLAQDPSERSNLAAQYPDKVAALQQRIDELAKQSEKPRFLTDQFKVITKNMHGEPILPTDEDFAGVETP